jgi:tetratricopeptide (TPR) repeat protein
MPRAEQSTRAIRRATPDRTPDVFLSHNSRNKEEVRKLYTILRRNRIRPWFDDEDLRPGDNWQREIEKAMTCARSAVVLVGREGVGPWEELEMRALLEEHVHRNKPVIPVLLPGAPRQPDLPAFLTLFTWVDLRAGLSGRPLERLISEIKGKRSPRQTAARWGPASARLQNIPLSLGDSFQGRDADLKALWDTLGGGSAAGPAVQARVLYGLGGVGKTRLAVEYARHHGSSYEASFFVSARSGGRLRAQLAGLAGLIGSPEREARSEEVAYESVLRWLRENTGWLLILDGIDTEEASTEVIEQLPLLSGGQVLMTSRISRWPPGFSLQEVAPISLEDAARYLLLRTASNPQAGNEHGEAIHLAELLGGLPLALEQAATYVLRTRITLGQYRENWDRLLDKPDRTTGYDRSVTVTFQQTVSQLGPTAEALLRLLAHLAPEPIPEELILASSDVLVQAEESLQMETERPVVLSPPREALADLADYSMVHWGGGIISVQRVVQEVTRRRIPIERQGLWAESALRLVDDFSPDPNDERYWPLWDRLRPHAVQVIDRVRRYHLEAQAFRLMNQLATLLGARAIHSQEAERLMEEALAIGQREFGDVPEVATAMHNLAQLRKASRPDEAEDLVRKALAIDKAGLGPTHPNVARDLDTLASLVRARGELTQAESFLCEALTIVEKTFGASHPNITPVLNDLANLLEEMNRLTEAENLMRRVLAIDAATQNEGHTHATHLSNFALLLARTIERLKEAEPLLRRALAIDRAAFGANHPNVARDLSHLANLLHQDGRSKEAEPLLREALKIDETSSGPNHRDVAVDLHNLASLLRAQGRLHEATENLQRARDIFEASLGPAHPHTQTAGAELVRLRNEVEEHEVRKAPKRKAKTRPTKKRISLVIT